MKQKQQTSETPAFLSVAPGAGEEASSSTLWGLRFHLVLNWSWHPYSLSGGWHSFQQHVLWMPIVQTSFPSSSHSSLICKMGLIPVFTGELLGLNERICEKVVSLVPGTS